MPVQFAASYKTRAIAGMLRQMSVWQITPINGAAFTDQEDV
jgi:hypothetical protein